MPVSRFVITGYPRSRTGWLANLFNYGPSFCLHDGLRFGPTMEAKFDAALDQNPKLRHLGNSDCGYLLGNEVPARAKLVIVERDHADAYASYLSYFLDNPYPHLGPPNAAALSDVFIRAESALRFLGVGRGPEDLLRVRYEDLDSEDAVRAVWNFIVPEEPFFAARWQVLDTLRVNPASEKVRA